MGKRTDRNAEIREFILSNVEKHPQDITAITAKRFSVSKQAVRKHIQALIGDGVIGASGATRARKYILKVINEFSGGYRIDSELPEDKIWREEIQPRLLGIKQNVVTICQYGFTEMVNNVIDHSEGRQLFVHLLRTSALIELTIADDGVGIFNKISEHLGLSDPMHSVLELAKGKMTTDPKHHTGEGIFFTSRVFDNFVIMSGRLVFIHMEADNDWLIEEEDRLYQGTNVELKIDPASTRSLQDVFNKYAGKEDYGFSRTHVPVNLARYGDENLVSRSQAKRLLTRFERFKEIVLDFSNVEMIGQAFADEIFRVFRADHPHIHLNYINVNEQVEKMILRVEIGS